MITALVIVAIIAAFLAGLLLGIDRRGDDDK
jgi:hypothetical protein